MLRKGRHSALFLPQVALEFGWELEETLDIKADPVQTAVFRWPESFPQAYVNHLDLVDGIEASLPAGIFVAGSSYRGIGVPDCVRQGKITAVETINYLNGN